MKGFPSALQIILKHEGALSDHPDDPGGVTLKGISLRFLKAVGFDTNQDGQITREDVLGLSDGQISTLYRERFWNACRCHEMGWPLSLCVFDSAVNQGPGAAGKMLQKVVGATVDGQIGNQTVLAVHAKVATGQINEVVRDFMAHRIRRYFLHPKIVVFWLGWIRRVLDVYKAAQEV